MPNLTPSLRVPPQYQQGLFKLRVLTPELRGQLASALRQERAVLLRQDLSERVAFNVPQIPRQDVDEIVDALFGLYSGRAITGLSLPDFVASVCRPETLETSEQEAATLRDLLVELLGFDSLVISAKSLEVLQENQHTFVDARILTDLRPVFKGEPPEVPVAGPPAAFVIIHNLKITHLENGFYKDFVVAMDTQDVARLGKQLERAASKADSLRGVTEAAQVPYLEIQSRIT